MSDSSIYMSSLCLKNIVIDKKSYNDIIMYHIGCKIQYSVRQYFHELTGQLERYSKKILILITYNKELSFW